MDIDEELESEIEAPVKSVSEETGEKIDFKFPSNMFPVNPDSKTDTDINDEGRAEKPKNVFLNIYLLICISDSLIFQSWRTSSHQTPHPGRAHCRSLG